MVHSNMGTSLLQRLLNEHEVANTCAISVATLRKWRTLKRGPCFLKIGSLVRYRVNDLDAWIERQAAYPIESVGVAQ